MPEEKPHLWLGVAAGVVAVALTTVIVYPLKLVAADISLSVVFLLPVLLIASYWGAALAVATAVASAMAFNFFHIPPTGRLTIADGENWVALAVFLVAALVASALADAARSRALEADERRREADLAAQLSRTLLHGDDLQGALAVAAQHLATALALPSAAIELTPVAADEGRLVLQIGDSQQIAWLVLPAGVPESTLARIEERVAPALAGLIAAALERDALLHERVETRALRRSDVLKTALLRSVSHDLRSPLTAILAAAEPLGGGHLDDAERRELAAGVTVEARRLARLIDQLLDLSRLQAQSVQARPDWCSLEEVLRAAVDEVATPATFSLSLDNALPLVQADAAQLERAFANLLENSARYAGGHPVSVRARPVGNRVLVRIVDRGPGIAPTDLERVFEPFYRSRDDRAAHPGSGLGLAIARGFLEVNGARVWAESLPNQGTSFVVAVPLQPATAAVTVTT